MLSPCFTNGIYWEAGSFLRRGATEVIAKPAPLAAQTCCAFRPTSLVQFSDSILVPLRSVQFSSVQFRCTWVFGLDFVGYGNGMLGHGQMSVTDTWRPKRQGPASDRDNVTRDTAGRHTCRHFRETLCVVMSSVLFSFSFDHYIINWQSLRLQTVPGNGACLRHCPSEGQCLRAGALGHIFKVQMAWTLLGIILFLRSLYSKFRFQGSSVEASYAHRQQRNAAPRWEAP